MSEEHYGAETTVKASIWKKRKRQTAVTADGSVASDLGRTKPFKKTHLQDT